MITTSITSLSLLLAGFQVTDDWGKWGDTRSAIEYSSLLSCLDIDPKNNRLDFNDQKHPLVSVYVPPNYLLRAGLTTADGKLLYVKDFVVTANPLSYPFQRITPKVHTQQPFAFTEEGDYLLTFSVNRVPITQLAFTVEFAPDPITNRPVAVATGPWEKWAYLWFPYGQREIGRPEVRLWRRVSSDAGSNGDTYTVEVLKGNSLVGEASSKTVTTLQQTQLRFPLLLPERRGGGQLLANEFLARTGTYHVLVKKNGKVDAVYPFEVEKKFRFSRLGAVNQSTFQFHRNQMPNHIPLGDFIVPRMPSDIVQRQGGGDTIWMNRLSSIETIPFQDMHPYNKKSPVLPQFDHWLVKPAKKPSGPFEIVITDLETPANTMLAAGDGVIAFGTGPQKGVQYLIAGDPDPHRIPDGDRYSSQVFFVAGKKIVLVKDRQVCIYDTTTESLFTIPREEVFLFDVQGGLHDPGLIYGDGYLIATVNDTGTVSDSRLIKVIDLSEDVPKIIPLRNANYEAPNISSIAVSAKSGQLAVSSRVNQSISVAKVSKTGSQRTIDLSSDDGVDARQIQFGEEHIAYADTKNRLRALDVASGQTQIINTKPLGATSRGFVVRDDQLAVATNQKFGSRYRYLTGPFPGMLREAPKLGEPIDGHPGYGMGGCAAIAEGGTVFLAGTQSFGVGKTLQGWQGGHWHVFRDAQGQPMPALDVTAGSYTLAFKTQTAAGKTVVAYATHGDTIALPANEVTANSPLAENSESNDPDEPHSNSTTEALHVGTVKKPGEKDSTPSANHQPTGKRTGLKTQLGLILTVLLAHVGIGIFFSRKILQ